MKTLSLWAFRNKWLARISIMLLQVTLIILAYLLVSMIGIEDASFINWTLPLLLFGACFLILLQKAKEGKAS